MTDMELFEDQILNQILHSELEAGNEIAEQSAWPPKCETLIILKYRFKRQHPSESNKIAYRVIDDRHYWYAEYATENGSECLACRF